MGVKVGGCYYCEGKLAVATCAECGVGICRDCAVTDDRDRIICYQCGNKILKQQHKEYKKELKEQGGRFRQGTEFVVPAIIGILIVVVVVLLDKFGAYYLGNTNILIGIIPAYVFFSIPFGVIWINDIFAPKYDTWGDRLTKIVPKIMFAVCFGWIFFTFYLIRFIATKCMGRKS